MLVYLNKFYRKVEYEWSSNNFSLSKNYEYHKCAQEDLFFIIKKGAMKEKMCVCFNIKTTRAEWIQSILRLWLNLCSRKWPRPRYELVRNLILLQLQQLQALFGDGLINFNRVFLKTLRQVALQRLGSSLFQ